MRRLATVQEIKELLPIPNADRIEIATMKDRAWKVIVRKGEFEAGDKAIYFETDTFLPEKIQEYSEFQKRGQKTVTHEGEDLKGHVLRTMRMRGVYSQGLLLPLGNFELSKNLEVGTDVSEEVGVLKYEEPLPMGNQEIIGRFETKFAPKTDSERIQNLTEHWNEIKTLEWEPSLKIDGTSQTFVNDDGEIRVFGRNWELNPETAPIIEVLEENGVLEFLMENPGVTVQAELAGPGISGNRLKLSKAEVFIFSVWKNLEKLPRSEWDEVLIKNAAPELSVDEWGLEGSVDEMIQKVEGLREKITKGRVDEGIVYHLVGDAPIWLEGTKTIKVINNKYLAKHGL